MDIKSSSVMDSFCIRFLIISSPSLQLLFTFRCVLFTNTWINIILLISNWIILLIELREITKICANLYVYNITNRGDCFNYYVSVIRKHKWLHYSVNLLFYMQGQHQNPCKCTCQINIDMHTFITVYWSW